MEDKPDADQLRNRMQLLRSNLDADFQQVGQQVRDRTDWRYYVKRYPWLAAGVAVAVGYAAVPRRIRKIAPDLETLTRLAKQEKLVVAPQSKASDSKGLGAQLFALAATGVARAAMGYLTGKAGEMSGQMAKASEQTPPQDSDTPTYSRPK